MGDTADISAWECELAVAAVAVEDEEEEEETGKERAFEAGVEEAGDAAEGVSADDAASLPPGPKIADPVDGAAGTDADEGRLCMVMDRARGVERDEAVEAEEMGAVIVSGER